MSNCVSRSLSNAIFRYSLHFSPAIDQKGTPAEIKLKVYSATHAIGMTYILSA